jgi:hypothetical protein
MTSRQRWAKEREYRVQIMKYSNSNRSCNNCKHLGCKSKCTEAVTIFQWYRVSKKGICKYYE